MHTVYSQNTTYSMKHLRRYASIYPITQTRNHNNIQEQCYNTTSNMCKRNMPTILISLWKCFRFPICLRILSDYRVIFKPIGQMSGIIQRHSEGRPQRLYLCVWTLKWFHILIHIINLKHLHRLYLVEFSLFKQPSYLPLYVDRLCLLYCLLCCLLCYVLFSLSQKMVCRFSCR